MIQSLIWKNFRLKICNIIEKRLEHIYSSKIFADALTLKDPYISESCIEIKIKFNGGASKGALSL